MQDFLLFSGAANPDLVAAIARDLDHRVSPSRLERFPDGEFSRSPQLEHGIRGIATSGVGNGPIADASGEDYIRAVPRT